MSKNNYTIAETFVGAGGAHLGFKTLGFESVYINEINLDCLKTLKYNNPEIFKTSIVDNMDINDINVEEISQKLTKKVDVLFGGIVCKSFSLAGERSPIDNRNYLYLKQIELTKQLRPKVSVIENVPAIMHSKILDKENINEDLRNNITNVWQELENIKGSKADKRKKMLSVHIEEEKATMLRSQKKEILKYLKEENLLINVFDDIIEKFQEIGYNVFYKILNSKWYGSATSRERVFIVAIRNDINKKFEFPKITHVDDLNLILKKTDVPVVKNYKNVRTVEDALNKIDYAIDDEDNKPMKHNEKTKRRFSFIPEGKNIQSVIDIIPDDLKVSKFYSRGSTMRLDRKKPSPTLVPGHSNFPVHPFKDRSITVREAGVISGFPLDYKFIGNHSKRCEHVGNAVPVELSTALANAIKLFLESL